MNALTNAYLTPADDLALVVLLNDASQMSEPTIEVIGCKELSNPRIKLAGRDGYVYTVALTDKDEQKTVREIYMACSEGSKPDYDLVSFIAPEAEGDNFYKTPRAERWTKEEITPAIKEALDLFDHPLNEPSVKVLKREERHHPEQKLWGREGFAYTVKITEESGKKSVRELYMFCSEGCEKDYNLVEFVAEGAEGDHFYKKPAAQRWGNEVVTPEIKKALDHFDHPSKAKKNHDLNGDEARARLCVVGRPRTEYKPN